MNPESVAPASPQEDEDGDRHLLDRAAAGDSRAFEVLVERHADRVFSLVLRLVGDRQLAEEITQDTFLRLSHSLGTLRVERTLSGWLRTVAVNLCRDAWRRQRSRPAHTSSHQWAQFEVADQAPNPGRFVPALSRSCRVTHAAGHFGQVLATTT